MICSSRKHKFWKNEIINLENLTKHNDNFWKKWKHIGDTPPNKKLLPEQNGHKWETCYNYLYRN